MPELETSRSAPAGHSTPTRPQITRPRSSTTRLATHPNLQHAFSFQHLDDVSNYHADQHYYPTKADEDSTDYSDNLEKVRREDEEEAARDGETELAKVQTGVGDARDLEANLEKTKSSKSVKDPNLVRTS